MDVPYELVILVNQSPGGNQYPISQYCIILTRHWYSASNESATNGCLISIR